ncbi:dihydroxyacetone kinase transcriptional activator DhaS [Enterococcus wangshanyuanii]|uniref:Dihydroxyacetone kinase transcriptional activator DhaS n=1 Tax=Enterococcus wangshanyuanii TaxID=2005703 RepID=A0ABQ1PE91_9ENTE|nr:dihydroxyacetone kinase transcriptional activator DhaS [Enterococcus wangshanyuanii]GGC95426.1 dihydroxyacetone kinase transcriptional activator DhaS [Enterococcus wangshanyuanii]
MTGSLITKKKIAKVFKKLVGEIGFEKVTIAKIMQESKMRRQTFYDHFQDKYELADWIFQQEAIEKIEDNLAYEDWQTIVENLFVYFEENQLFYRKILQFDGQNSFQEYYTQHLKSLIKQVLVVKSRSEKTIDSCDLLFLEDFYATAFVSMTTKWIIEGCSVSSEQFAKQMRLAFLMSFDEKK